MITEANKRASKKYNEKNTTMLSLRLNKKTDADILQRLEKIGNKQGYIKELMRKEIKEQK